MTQCYIQDALLLEKTCVCDNCDHKCSGKELDMITDIEQRLTPGGIVPSGQCPECGGLMYPEDEGSKRTQNLRVITKYEEYKKIAHPSRTDVLDAFKGTWVVWELGYETEVDHFSIRGEDVNELWIESEFMEAG